jgi:tetratricopeptide (TPR) repeat protein
VLKQKLMVDRNCQKMSIVGLGGTGKTQVALQFAYMVKEIWPEYSVFWMPALSMESFEQACRDVVRALRIPQAAGEEDAKELMKQHLSAARVGKWLLVVDNADDRSVVIGNRQSKGVVDYLPQSEEGVILFTTRVHEVAVSLTRSDLLKLGPMERQDAVNFLETSLTKKGFRDNATTSELLDELAYLPLAIVQAIAYLNINEISIARYLHLLRSTEQGLVGLMSREFRDDTRYNDSANAVATTWIVSFNQIRTHNAVAADLLFFMSCIEWKAIPRSILPSVQSEVQMEDAIGTLCGYSILARRDNEDWYDMHRLVHLATQIWIRQYGDTRGVVEKGIRHVANVFPPANHENRAVWGGYLSHTLRLLEDKKDYGIKERSELCLLVGQCLRVDGRVREAVRWLEESYQERTEVLTEDHPDRLASQHVLAIAYQANGQIKEAVKLLEAVVAIQAEVLAEDHPNRLESQHSLAIAYQANGQIKEAVKLLEAVVAIQAEVLAEDHPDRLESQHSLAVAYQANGQIKEAVKLLEAVVAIQAEVLAEDHPNQLASQHELAVAYQANGQIKEAVKLLEAVVAIRTEVLAEDHPDRLASQHALAAAYQANGQIKEAVKLLEAVVAIQAEVLAEDHPSRLALQHNLARAYQANGQIKEAVKLLEAVVAIQAEVLAEDHPNRLASQHELARAYQANGQIKEAVKLLEAVVAIEVEVLAEDHPNRLASQHVLAVAYQANGQIKEAVELLEAVVAIEVEVLAEDHPNRLASQHVLAVAYQANGQIKEAVELLEAVVAIRTEVLAEDHHSRLATSTDEQTWTKSVDRSTAPTTVDPEPQRLDKETDTIDMETIYTSATNSDMRQYMDQLADDLFCNAFSEGIPDNEILHRVSKRLPGLLQGFALKIGGENQTFIYGEIMSFVYRKRE